jgi:hypothetical protein
VKEITASFAAFTIEYAFVLQREKNALQELA